MASAVRFSDAVAITNIATEVQAKKVFTAEELSMRRAEMARRRRNLSEKRNEEVKACPPPVLLVPYTVH